MALFPTGAALAGLLTRLPAAAQQPAALFPLFQALWAKVQAVDDALRQQNIPWPPPLARDVMALARGWADEAKFAPKVAEALAAAWALALKAGYVTGATPSPAALAADERAVRLVGNKVPMLGRLAGTYIMAVDQLPQRINHVDKEIDKVTGGAMPTAAAILADWRSRGQA